MPNQGEVEIELGNEKIVLRSTLRAARAVNNMGGGFVGAFERLRQFDLSAFAVIIATGSGAAVSRVGEIEEKVYANGMTPLLEPLTKFVAYLHNGGKEPAPPQDEDPAAEGNG